ncbi:MAG TPA: PilN domain-containing protein [Baekduia sp.]|uniref:PilN domain-containing protein n=1 Tax=Baekduia sp. TaxID=2600305 RepID=UPI002D795141|nr:PilN domain-containing protein [Baekduia sp.]HET6506304.1 PilN domain-containing protein [Baekduia sp.]
MRAVNLIPSDQQRGAGGAAGKSGGGAYILLGALALLVVLAATYVVSNKSVSDKRDQLADVTQQAEAAEAKAAALTSYTKFASIRQKRVDTVTQLAGSRFDWAHALREVARVLPQNVWLTSLTGTTSTTVQLSSSGGAGGGSLRGSLNVPAIVISGCTTSQKSVAMLITRLRMIDGVQRVTLEDSSRAADANPSGSSATTDSAGGSDCRGGHAKYPIFNADVFFEQSGAAVSTSTGTAATASSVASSASPSSTTTPSTTASSTAPASGTTGGASQ